MPGATPTWSHACARPRQARAGGATALTEAVARYYFKLLAIKDEYEVARLYTETDFVQRVAAQFEGDYKLTFHLAPPLMSRMDPTTGQAKKAAYGPWMLKAFGVLAKLRRLRGTPLDVFARTAERKMERGTDRRVRSARRRAARSPRAAQPCAGGRAGTDPGADSRLWLRQASACRSGPGEAGRAPRGVPCVDAAPSQGRGPRRRVTLDPFTPARAWFAAQGYAAFPFQEEVWAAYARGESGLVHAATGMGKTYAAALPPMALGDAGAPERPPPLALLWITPLRALAADTGVALTRAAAALAAPLAHRRAHRRHGARGTRAPGQATAHGARHHAGEPRPCCSPAPTGASDSRTSRAVVVDEWHELLATKRGVQVELALARLRGCAPGSRASGACRRRSAISTTALACLVGIGGATPARVVQRT